MKFRCRRSIRVLILALLLMMLPLMILPVHANNFLGDAAGNTGNRAGNSVERAGEAVGDLARDASDAVGNMVGEIFDDARDGRVRDSDGFIGNERTELANRSADTEQGMSNAWLGWVIAIVVTAVIVTMIVILIPRKRED